MSLTDFVSNRRNAITLTILFLAIIFALIAGIGLGIAMLTIVQACGFAFCAVFCLVVSLILGLQ